jgi:hypothetical protein
MTDVDDIVNEFTNDLEVAVRAVMISKGLSKQDEVVKTIEFKEQKDGVFVLIANDYYSYVSTGRKPRARKVPIVDLIKWIKEKRIRTGNINSLAFAIQTSIYKHGIKGKKYADEVEDTVADVSEIKIADGLEDALVESIDKNLK